MPTPPSPTPEPKPAPNPFTSDLTKPGEGQVPASGPPPIGAEDMAGLKQKHKIFLIAGGAIIFLILVTGIPLAVLSSQKKQAGFTPTPTPGGINNNTNIDAKARTELKQKIYFKTTTTTRTGYDLSLKAPTAWNGSLSTTPSNPANTFPWESSLLGIALISRYSPLSSANPSAPASNYLAIIDITDWLTNDKNKIPFNKSTKQGWYNALMSITAENAGNTGGAVANPRYASEPGGRQSLKYIQTADQQLHGISYVTLFDGNVYDPQIVTMMAGSFDKRSVILYSVHGVRDKTWNTLADLKTSNDPAFGEQQKQALTRFKTNQLDADTRAVEEELLEAISTLRMTKLGQENGTVSE